MSTTIAQRRAPAASGAPMPAIDRVFRAAVHRRLAGIQVGGIEFRDSLGAVRFGGDDDSALSAVAIVHDSRFYRAAAIGGSLGAADAYIRGWWSADELTTLLRLFARNLSAADAVEGGFARLVAPFQRLAHFARRNTRSGSRRNIHAHYDLGNDFFALFLDETMTYSCGIFESEHSTMLDASIAKIDRLCRQLELGPDDHLLEIGTGWGSLAIHAAREYGCRVTTTTISQRQHELAAERVRDAGLGDRVELLHRDYRDLDGQYDKLVSVEMIEAVGHRFLGQYFRALADRLKPGGLMAIQAITMPDDRYEQYRRSVDFIQRYVFPGSCVPSVKAMTNAFEATTTLGLVGVEEIGPHYAKTLRCWRDRFFERIDEVRAMGYDDEFIRLWEYYLCYSEAGFEERYIGDVHMVLAKPGPRGSGSLTYKIINLILVNLGWFACVLGASYGRPWTGPVAVAVLAGVHVACRPHRQRELALLIGAGILGYVIDSALVLGGAVSFPESARLGGPSTLWMVALWINVATSMHASFEWLLERPVVAALIGAVGGPLAYLAGVRLGAISLGNDRAVSIAAIGAAWFVAMPALAWLGTLTRAEPEPQP